MSQPEKSPSVPRLCLFGASLDVGNMGCRALSHGLIRLLHQMRPEAEIRLLYGNRTGGKRRVRLSSERSIEVEVLNFRLSPKARWSQHLAWIVLAALLHRFLPIPALRRRLRRAFPWLKALYEADLAGEIRGGDSFADIYGFKRFFMGVLPCCVALLMGARLVFLPQTYGPFAGKASAAMAGFLLRHSSDVIARDKKSREVARQLMGASAAERKVYLCPDVAFGLAAIEPDVAAITPPLPERSESVLVGLNVSGLLYMGGYTGDNMFGLQCDYPRFIESLIRELLNHQKVHLLLIPHTFGSAGENDRDACRKVYDSLHDQAKDRLHLLESEHDQNEIKWLIGQCDFFLGSRMHACIAALSQSVPAVGLAYSRKFAGVFEVVGVEESVLDMTQMEEPALLSAARTLFENRDASEDFLQNAIPKVRQDLDNVFQKTVVLS